MNYIVYFKSTMYDNNEIENYVDKINDIVYKNGANCRYLSGVKMFLIDDLTDDGYKQIQSLHPNIMLTK